MKRLAEEMVFSGLSTAWRLASWPTRRSPVLVNPTTDGVRRLPSLLIITVGLPPSMTATTEFVVPRSIPIAFAITNSYLRPGDANGRYHGLCRRGTTQRLLAEVGIGARMGESPVGLSTHRIYA